MIEKDTGFKMVQEVAKQILFSVERKKQKPYRKEVKNKFSELIITAEETITSFDQHVLSAITSYVYEHLDKIIDEETKNILGKFWSEIQHQLNEKDVDKLLKQIYTAKIPIYYFIKNYMHKEKHKINKKMYKKVIDSVRKLHTLNIRILKTSDGKDVDTSFFPIPFLRIEFDESELEKKENKTSSIYIGFSFLFLYFIKYPTSLYINNYYIQKTRSSIATALVSFLQTTTANTYSLSFLSNHLQLEKKRIDNMKRDFKNAFKELVKIGYLESFKEEKRGNDIYFHFVRKHKLSPTIENKQ